MASGLSPPALTVALHFSVRGGGGGVSVGGGSGGGGGGGGGACTGTQALSLAGLLSRYGPQTISMQFSAPGGMVPGILAVTVKVTGTLGCITRSVGCLQRNSAPDCVQVQGAGVTDSKVAPAGSVSLSSGRSVQGSEPLLISWISKLHEPPGVQ